MCMALFHRKHLQTHLKIHNNFLRNIISFQGTFYVSHEWTDYSQVQDLYADGHEIASHTITHSHGTNFNEEKWANEVVGEAEMLVRFAGVNPKDIKGMRAPFLAIGGDTMFNMLNRFDDDKTAVKIRIRVIVYVLVGMASTMTPPCQPAAPAGPTPSSSGSPTAALSSPAPRSHTQVCGRSPCPP